MSQIGYMMLGAGLGPAGYAFAIAQLLAHGFFKAGLFLGAGSVMHGMDDEVNMRRYGALARVMPITAVTFAISYLAIIGIPPFSAFFTKDPIIDAAWDQGGTAGWLMGGAAIIGAGITGFYMTRMVLMTFTGAKRWEEHAHPHESPAVMTAPMIVLAIGSIVAGAFLIINNRLVDFLAPVVGTPPVLHGVWSPCQVRPPWRWRSLPPCSRGLCTGACRCPRPRRGATWSRTRRARSCTATRSTSRC